MNSFVFTGNILVDLHCFLFEQKSCRNRVVLCSCVLRFVTRSQIDLLIFQMLPSMPILFSKESQDAFGNKIEPSTSFFSQNSAPKPPKPIINPEVSHKRYNSLHAIYLCIQRKIKRFLIVTYF